MMSFNLSNSLKGLLFLSLGLVHAEDVLSPQNQAPPEIDPSIFDFSAITDANDVLKKEIDALLKTEISAKEKEELLGVGKKEGKEDNDQKDGCPCKECIGLSAMRIMKFVKEKVAKKCASLEVGNTESNNDKHSSYFCKWWLSDPEEAYGFLVVKTEPLKDSWFYCTGAGKCEKPKDDSDAEDYMSLFDSKSWDSNVPEKEKELTDDLLQFLIPKFNELRDDKTENKENPLYDQELVESRSQILLNKEKETERGLHYFSNPFFYFDLQPLQPLQAEPQPQIVEPFKMVTLQDIFGRPLGAPTSDIFVAPDGSKRRRRQLHELPAGMDGSSVLNGGIIPLSGSPFFNIEEVCDASLTTCPSHGGHICPCCYKRVFRAVMDVALEKVHHVCETTKCPFVKGWCSWAHSSEGHLKIATGMVMGMVEPWKYAIGRCWEEKNLKAKEDQAMQMSSNFGESKSIIQTFNRDEKDPNHLHKRTTTITYNQEHPEGKEETEEEDVPIVGPGGASTSLTPLEDEESQTFGSLSLSPFGSYLGGFGLFERVHEMFNGLFRNANANGNRQSQGLDNEQEKIQGEEQKKKLAEGGNGEERTGEMYV